MLVFVIMILAYVLGSLGFYAIASRRGIKHAWLAWVPVANAWLLGCISDQYQSVAMGKEKRKRTWLLVINIAFTLCVVVMVVLVVALTLQILAYAGDYLDHVDMVNVDDPDAAIDMMYEDLFADGMPQEMLDMSLRISTVSIVLTLISVPMMVVRFMALYDVFRSCDPSSALLYLLLSIFLGISSFLVFACKDKDYGMPPKETPPPVYTPYQPPYGGPDGISYGAPGGISYGQPPQPDAPAQEPWEKES